MKRKHTKLICLGLALCLLTGLALGCGSSANDTKTASASSYTVSDFAFLSSCSFSLNSMVNSP